MADSSVSTLRAEVRNTGDAEPLFHEGGQNSASCRNELKAEPVLAEGLVQSSRDAGLRSPAVERAP